MIKNALCVAALVFCTLYSFATEPQPESGQAYIDHNYCLTLDLDFNLYDTYEIDITALNLSSEGQAKSLFASIMSNLISFEVDYANQKTTLILHRDRTGDIEWTKTDWVDYLDSRCKAE